MDYTIKLGVEVDTDGLQGKINAAVGDLKPITLGIEFDDVKKEIKSLTHELKTLNNKSNFKLDTSMVEKSLSDVASVIRDIKTSIGTLDAGAGMKSLLTSINQISTALERASGQFEGLNAALETLGSKDFNINLGINMGGSNNPIARNAAYGNKVRNETLPQLKKQAEELENYLKKYYKVTDGFNAAQKLLQGTNAGNGKANLYDLLPKMLDSTGSLSNQMTAWKEYISLIREAANIKGIDISSVTSQFSSSADKLVQDAQDVQSGAKEAEQSFEKLKQIFGGGSSIDAEGLSTQLNSIVADLGEIRTAIQNLSSSTSLDGLTASFNGLSETLKKLNDNIVLVQNSLSAGFSGLANVGSGAIGNVENVSDTSTAVVIQNEKKKQEAYKATAETVMYHAGVVSKLNKAETNGRFYGSNRGTGYFGTGHYFVDSATKHELDGSYHYNKLPYTSIDISKYDNLFRVTSDEVGYALHGFLKNLTRFTQGADDFSVDELFSQFKNVFGDVVMDVKEFGSRIEQLKTFMSKSDFYDRSDSVSTQFMKSLGYGGIDTRGTSLADTEYGTVIYDLREESVLQANITDEVQKRGQMLEKINYEQGQVFDKDTDDRILKEIDDRAKRREAVEEYERSFDETDYNKARDDLNGAKDRIRQIDETIAYYQGRMNDLDDAYEEYVRDSNRGTKELRDLGLDVDDWLDDDWLDESLLIQDEDEWKEQQAEIMRDSINELSQEKAKLQSEMPSLEEAYNRELQLAQEAMERAKQVVEQRHLEAQKAKEAVDVVVQGEEKKQEAIQQTSDENERALANSVSTNISNGLKNADIEIEATESQLKNLKTALSTIGFEKSSVESIASDFEKLGITVKKVSSLLRDDGSVTLTVKGIDQFGNAVTAINNISKDGSRSSWATAISKDFDETEKAFKRLKALGKEISGLDIKIAGLDADKNKAEIKALKTEVNKFAKEYDNLFAITQNKLAPSQINELNEIIASSNFTESRFRGNLVDGIKLNLGDSGNFETKVQEIESSVRRLSNVPDELEGNVKRLRDALTGMTTASEEGDINKLISKYKEFVKVQGEVENQLKQTKISQDEAARAQKKANDEIKLAQKKENFSNEINNWLRENTKAAADFGDRIQDLQRRLKSCDDIELGNLREEWKGIKLEAKLAGKTGGTFADKIKSQFEKYSAYFGVAELFMYAEQGLRDMFEQVKLIDSAMTELKKVTNETDATYNAFLKNAATKSKEIGTTIDGFVSSTADFARLGYDFEESQGLAEVANIYAVVGDEIDGVEGATQSLVSTLAAFKDEMNGMSDSDFAMSIVDKFNEVSNNFAISSGGIGEAMERSASSLKAANNTIDESIAMITAANEVTQNPEKVGKWLCRL